MSKSVFALVFTLILLLLIPSSLFALTTRGMKPKAVTLGGFSITPTINEYMFSNFENRDITQMYGVKVGYEKIDNSFIESLGIEGTLNYFTAKTKQETKSTAGYLFRLDAIYPYIFREKWMPFFAVGGGTIVMNSSGHKENDFLFNYGAGLKYFFEDYLALRTDFRHILVYDSVGTRNNFEMGIGVSYYFGKERIKPTSPLKIAEKKPAEKVGSPVDRPLVPPIAAVPLLPLEPLIKPLIKSMINADAIPAVGESAPQAPVEIKKTIKNMSIEFGTDRFEVKQKYNNELNSLAKYINSINESSVLIEGHTDSTGQLKHNIKLSQQRSESVRNLLINAGVDPSRISIVFYGPLRPVASNATPIGRQQNRRTQIIVTVLERAINIKAEHKPQHQVLPNDKKTPINLASEVKTEQKPLPQVSPTKIAAPTEESTKEKKGQNPSIAIDPEAVRQENARRLQTQKLDKESIRTKISVYNDGLAVPVGAYGILPVEITNSGNSLEKFVLEISADKKFKAIMLRSGGSEENVSRLQLAAGESFNGSIIFSMPNKMVDGDRSSILINVISSRYSDVIFSKNVSVSSSAPHMRVDASFSGQSVVPGEKLHLNINILNAGSQPAQDLTVRVKLPPQVNYIGAPGVVAKRQPNGMLFINIGTVEVDKTVNLGLDVEVSKDSADGDELRPIVEVVNGSLQRIDVFSILGTYVKSK